MNKKHFQSALERLSRENRQSPFLNCLTRRGGSGRIDLKALDSVGPFTARDVLRALYGNREFKIHIPLRLEGINDPNLYQLVTESGEQLDFTLRRLYNRNDEIRHEKGCDALYLGFPVLQHRHPSSNDLNFTAPLLFWKVTLKPSPQHDYWILERQLEDPIRINFVLRNWLQDNKMPLPLEPKAELLDQGLLDYEEMKRYIAEIASIFKVEGDWTKRLRDTDTLGPDVLPLKIDDQNTPMGYRIYTSCVLGVFQAYREAIIQDLQTYINHDTERDFSHPGNPLFDRLALPALALDASQFETHRLVGQGKHLVVHGPPGTGKSTVLTAMILSALANQRKVLMVCEKKAALDVIANRLNQLNLEQVYALVQDASADRKKIVVKARHFQDSLPVRKIPVTVFPDVSNQSWLTLVEKWDAYRLEHAKELLSGKNLEDLWLEFLKTSSEYTQKNSGVGVKEWNFGEDLLPSLLENIDHKSDWISVLDQVLADRSLTLKWMSFAEQCNWPVDVLEDGHKFCKRHAKEMSLMEEEVRSLTALVRLMDDLMGYQEEHEFHLIHEGILRGMKWCFSPRYRKYLTLWNKFLLYLKARDPHGPVPGPDLHRYRNSLDSEWKEAQLKHHFYAEINATSEQMLQNFERCLKLSRPPYNWSALDFSKALEPYGGCDHQGLSEKVYYRICLSLMSRLIRSQSSKMNELFGDPEFQKALNLLEEVSLDSLNRIRHHHLCHAQQTISDYDKVHGFRRLYNIRGQAGQSRNSLHKIVNTDVTLFLSVFPLVMCTPETASVLFTGAEELFDLVMFDEASQMRVEESIASMLKGKTLVVAGDVHQMPPSNWFESTGFDLEEVEAEPSPDNGMEADSLLEYCVEHPAFSDSYLTYHYRSENPALIAFSNAAFYGKLRPLPLTESDHPFTISRVNGPYHFQTNLEEAKAIVQALLELVPQSDSYPSVGVVTLNLKQRDLIYSEIIKARLNDKAAELKFKELDKAGLFVRNLENIQGDERDIIMLSTTFGINLDGEFKRQFGKIGTKLGYRLLNVLITRARTGYRIFTSIPRDEWDAYAYLLQSRKENWGYGLFYAWLSYAEEIASGKPMNESAVLPILKSNNDAFVVNLLEPQSEEKRLLFLNKFCSLHSDLLGFESGHTIEVNGEFAHFKVDFMNTHGGVLQGAFLHYGLSGQHEDSLNSGIPYLIHRHHHLTTKNLKIQYSNLWRGMNAI